MAKTYIWSDTGGRIEIGGGTSDDPITFKNITDYFASNPLPLNYNMPKLYNGTTSIEGDTTTYSPTAGDKIAVTINGVLYDNIDISGTNSIIGVANLINTATAAYKYVSGYDVASVSSSHLKLTVRCEDEDGDITIADGSGTSVTCVAKLFNTATRTSTVTNWPYELCENNSAEWSGQGGFGTPADDSSAGDFTKGAYAITAQVSTVPTGTTITRVYTPGAGSSLTVYMADTSAFALHDEVEIRGTTNFNGVRFRITTISNNVYVAGYTPRYCPIVNETSIVGGTLIKPLMLAWNEGYTKSLSSIKGIALSDKFKISAKSDGVGSPKIVGIIIRGYYGSGSPYNFFYGSYMNVDWDLTSDWQNFEFDIRDSANYQWPANTSSRGYWSGFAKLYIVFDGLAQNENVWIDGVRFTNSDRNPKETTENNYVFTTGLQTSAGCYFKDYGFDVRFDVLESMPFYGYGFIYLAATTAGDIQLGDYSGNEKEGGVVKFNTFCIEDTGGLNFVNIQCQNITFMGFKDSYGGFNFSGNSGNNYRNCSWINMLNFFASEGNSTFKDCTMSGYRYFMAFPPAGVSIDGFTLYASSSQPFYIRTSSEITNIKGVKIIDQRTTERTLVGSDTYGSATTRYGVRLVNLDLSESGTNFRFVTQNYSIHTVDKSPINYIAFSLNATITDESGAVISGATITLKDKDGNQLFSTTTDTNGVIAEQYIDILKAQYDTIPGSGSSTKYFYVDTPTVDWIYYYPFTITISKTGFETYSDVLLKNGYSRTDEICKNGANLTIAIKRSPYNKIHLR